MKKRFLLPFAALVAGTILGYAEGLIVIAEGHFFKGFPKSAPVSRMVSVSTPEGTKAVGLILSEPLSAEALADTIPTAGVKEGSELLRRYAEAVEKINSPAVAKELRVGDRFPAFEATDIDGKTWTGKDVEGRVMVLNLWYTGCGPCRAEMPELSGWKDELPDVLFFSSTYESPEVARQVLDRGTFNWTHLVGDKQFTGYIDEKGYPLTIVVGKDGRIVAFEYGTSPEKRERLYSAIVEANK